MKRKIATILVADVVGYSALMHDDDTGTLELLKVCDAEIITPCVNANSGRVFKRTGDGFLVEFENAVDAVHCALEWQSRTRSNNVTPLSFRVGIHQGQVIVEDDDVYGDCVNIAARLEPMAQTGCIVVSDEVYQQVRGRIDARFDDLGAQEFKNILQPIHVWEWRCPFAIPQRLAKGDLAEPSKPSVVILPFRNLSKDPEHEVFAEGLRADVQSALTQVLGVFIVAMGAADQFRGATPEEAGPALGVRYALQCTMRVAGDRVRVTAVLIATATGEIVWTEQFDRNLDDGFALQDEIAAKVLMEMDVALVAGEQAKIWHKSLRSFKALELFYKGVDTFYRMNPEDMLIARGYFEKVTQMEPQSALGPMQVAMCFWYELQKGWAKDVSYAQEQAIRWAEEAASKEDEDGQALTVLSHVHLMRRDYDAALAAGREATTVRPGCANANAFFANVLHHCDEHEQARHHISLAMRFHPLNPPFFRNILSATLLALNEVEDAIVIASETTRLADQELESRIVLASAYHRADQNIEAKRVASEIQQIDPHFSIAKYVSSRLYRSPDYPNQLAADLRTLGLPQ
ncbi:adenylate/guanylate cyclase domain-containing protein [Ruegeria arenilitoris]|uniref:adenylate/guanylate cyclase domain-containing protein n=1 Tax=Ruegeria arenilitoris TaxID=1173585 RepID=UPI00147F0408|nr:adenylate/guanylate cyclase domain-containing protein [Ruegeria arenilitoris]